MRRIRFQYSLRTLLIAVSVVAFVTHRVTLCYQVQAKLARNVAALEEAQVEVTWRSSWKGAIPFLLDSECNITGVKLPYSENEEAGTLLQIASGWNGLESLVAVGNQLSDNDLRCLSHWPHLRYLHIAESRGVIDGSGIKYLARPEILQELDLSDNALDDACGTYISKCTRLRARRKITSSNWRAMVG